METCDDCGKEYAGAAYYTFPTEACQEGPDDAVVPHGDACTGNICPDCAGPYLEPDEPDDPRRPTE